MIIATGSEVDLAVRARAALALKGIHCRVGSMPSTFQFDRQDKAYRLATLPDGAPRLAVEAGVTDSWRKYVGLSDAIVGIDVFGESAPADELFEHFGFTAATVVSAVEALVEQQQDRGEPHTWLPPWRNGGHLPICSKLHAKPPGAGT
jgi:transketolase